MPMEIKLTGDAKDFNRVVDEAARKFDTLQQKASVGIGGKVTGGGNGGATATRGVGGAVVDEIYNRTGIYSRYIGEKRILSQLEQGTLEYADQEHRVRTAQAAIDRANRSSAPPPTMWDKINRAVSSSRIDASGNLMPLVGQLGSIVGPYGLAGAAAIGLGSAVYNRGLSSATELAQASYIGGGTAAESGAVAGIGAFLGRSAGQSQNAALGLADALHRGTYGAGVLRGLGIIDRGGIQVDKDTNYIAAVKAVTSPAMSRSQAIRVARDTGLTDELFLRDLDPADRDNFLADRERQLTPEARREAAYARLRATEIGGILDSESRNIVGHPIGSAIGGIAGGGLGVVGASIAGAQIGAMGGALAGPIGALVGGTAGLIGGAVTGAFIGADIGSHVDQGIHDPIGAAKVIGTGLLDLLTAGGFGAATRGGRTTESGPSISGDDPRFSPGYSGGGDIARQSIPAAWKYQQFQDALNGSADRLGGYAI